MEEEFQALLARLPTDRLRQIAIWKMEGYTNEEIAEKAGISPRMVAYDLTVIRAVFSAREEP